MTTRSKRPGEVNGSDYFFVTKYQFKNAIKNGEMLEYATYIDNYYGTPNKPVERLRKLGKNVLLEIEANGALQVMGYAKQKNDDKIITIFISPPSINELKKRLINRKTENLKVINKRIEQAKWEMSLIHLYKYNIINDKPELARDRLRKILMNEIK
jgi:guanylate kinase